MLRLRWRSGVREVSGFRARPVRAGEGVAIRVQCRSDEKRSNKGEQSEVEVKRKPSSFGHPAVGSLPSPAVVLRVWRIADVKAPGIRRESDAKRPLPRPGPARSRERRQVWRVTCHTSGAGLVRCLPSPTPVTARAWAAGRPDVVGPAVRATARTLNPPTSAAAHFRKPCASFDS